MPGNVHYASHDLNSGQLCPLFRTPFLFEHKTVVGNTLNTIIHLFSNFTANKPLKFKKFEKIVALEKKDNRHLPAGLPVLNFNLID